MNIQDLEYPEREIDIQGLEYPEYKMIYRTMTTRNMDWVYGVLISEMSLGLPFGVTLVRSFSSFYLKPTGDILDPKLPERESLDTNRREV